MLYQATFAPDYLKIALQLTREMRQLFGDQENGGFFFVGHDAEQLPSRTKQLHDGAIPSGNSVAALNLLRLARLTGNAELEEMAGTQLRTFARAIAVYPAGYTYFLCALSFALEPPMDIVIAGRASASAERINADDQTSPVFESTHNELFAILRAAYLPQATLLFHPAGEAGAKIAALSPSIADKNPLDSQTTVYLCQNYACQPPITDPAELCQHIQAGTGLCS